VIRLRSHVDENPLQSATQYLRKFIIQRSLPLWASSGFDEKNGSFEERLDFCGNPVRNQPRRLMAQCRQIVVYARASILGWHPGGHQLALRAFERSCQLYHSPDGEPGWIFSVRPDGKVVDSSRDLYAHAFVLYMLAWMYCLTTDPAILRLVNSTLSDIDQLFAVPDQPGFISRTGVVKRREQNPHMHLLEALLALAEITGDEHYYSRAGALIALFDERFSDATTGIVREIFDEKWVAEKPPGENVVEPGHQMEWIWLLREWQRLTGAMVDERVERLAAYAVRFGIDPKKRAVWSTVRENGEVVSSPSRIWPQTETIRALCREDPIGEKWPRLISEIIDNLFATHLRPALNGGWIDQVNEYGLPTVDYMPASTLYHLFGAAIEREPSSALGASIRDQSSELY
jgi:mannose/cellobiose epimerase-like protein (N-acyl-D-glucosamine 2-epimerase family)